MIFVTVGAQMPFDRLIRTVDEWAKQNEQIDVFAQIGGTHYRPQNIDWAHHLDPIEFRERVFESDAVIAHAGMGTILTALELSKPILVMPRKYALRETRNDHQFDTARAFEETGQIAVAQNEIELMESMDHLDLIPVSRPIASHASLGILSTLRDFILSANEELATQTNTPAAFPIYADDTAMPSQEKSRRKAA